MRFIVDTVGFGSPAHRDMVALRCRLLREPLGLAFTEEQLAAERNCVHLVLRHDDVVVGTLLLVPPDTDGVGRIRQMAIEPGLRRRGLGRALVRHGERELLRLGATRIALAARESAVGFYERLGYAVRGEVFIELTIPHVLMEKPLQGAVSARPAVNATRTHGEQRRTTNGGS